MTDFDEIVAVMKKCRVCRLALFDDEYPYVIPLNFGMKVKDNNISLYFHGAREGKKYDLIAANPHACFEMDCSHKLIYKSEKESCTWGMAYESVIGNGVIEILSDEEKEEGLRYLMAQFCQNECSFDPRVLKQTTLMKLNVHFLSCKRRSDG